ncbi:MAG: peptidylprolyl isomerase [Ruminococcus sp.]|nr:peptidylprolyl isomerase [Ruminococcus sp.]
MKKRIFAACISAMMLCAGLSGCGKELQIEEKPVLNFTAPAEGEEIVVIHVRDRGDIKIKLFADVLPEACENFTTLASRDYYNELIFHRVINNFMIQGGDPTGTGRGGESCWGGKFNGGVSDQLCNFAGALCYANSAGPSTDGSQFYIVTGTVPTAEDLKYYEEEYDQNPQVTYDINFTKEAEEIYQKVGGAPHLDGGYTVFGQVFEGLDIVFDIAAVATDGNNKPLDAVYIESVTVEKYDGSELRWYLEDYAE